MSCRPTNWWGCFQRTFAATIPNDYSWMRPNRRLIHAGLYLPGISREGVGELVIAIDCSGSINERQLGQFAGEVNALIEEHRPEKVHLLYFDTLIHDMRNGGDPRKPHGVCEVQWKNDHLIRNGWAGRLTDLRRLGRKGWKKSCPEPAWFVLGRERGKLSYYWKHVFKLAKSGKLMGALVNPDSGDRVLNSEGESLYGSDFRDSKRSEVITRGAQGADGVVSGSKMFSALWSADRSKLQRMAPLEYIGRYLKGWWNYSIADEVHELNGDTAQGNGLAVLARAAEKTIAMTGTIMGGYADDIYRVLYRMDGPRMARDGLAWGTQGQRAFQETYGTIEEIRKVNPQDNLCGRAPKANVTVRRRPGASPLLFGKYLMDSTAFIFLEDIAETLPAYEEQIIGIQMDKKLSKAYEELEKQIKDALHEYPKSGSSITSLMLNTLLVYPDHPFGFGPLKALVRDGNGEVQRVQVAEPENLDEGIPYPKEEWLIDDLRKERREGHRCLVFATYTGEHDVPFRLEQVLRREGFRVAVMRATVPTDRREAWIADRLREGVDVVLCHPRLVQTGLDLPAFPTIYFYETGYSLYTLRQASRRSWRIGQHRNVRVKFVHYLDTLQERCLRLMGKKLMVALAVEGKFTGEGLQDAGDEDAVDAAAFTAAFDEDGSWRRLSGRLRGYVHTDLLVRSAFPTVLLLLEFWQSEQHYAIAERNAEVRDFLRSLRNLAVSNQSLGVFCFRSQLEKEMIQGSPFQMPADLSGWRMRQ